jgi:hypothetical protein
MRKAYHMFAVRTVRYFDQQTFLYHGFLLAFAGAILTKAQTNLQHALELTFFAHTIRLKYKTTKPFNG